MATSKDYPEFSDICRTARDLERKLITVQPSQIAGSITHEASYEIFPKEMEEFTYSYLLNEAHKVERKLFASSYSSQLSTPGTGKGMDERQVESELARFASEAPSAPAPEDKPKQGFAIPKMPGIGGMTFPFGKKQQPAQAQQVSPPPVPSASEAPKEIEIARDSEAAGENEMRTRPPIIPPRLQKQQPAPPTIPSEEEEKFETPSQEKEEADETAEPKEVAPPEEETAKFAREVAPEPEPEEKEAPTRGALSSSKISPRLRAIIEEKLRKEEEKAAEEKGSADIEKPLEPEPENQREEDMPIMSARERLLRKLKREKPQEENEEPAHKEEAPEAEEEPEEKEAQPEEAQEAEEEPIEKEESEEAPRRILPVSPKEEPEEKEEYAKVSRAEKPPAKKAERQPSISPLRAVPSGGLVIKPVFSEGEKASPEEKEEAPQDDERMQRIQRIISELSPDRAKSAAISKGAAEAEAKPKGRKKPKPVEEEEPAPEEEEIPKKPEPEEVEEEELASPSEPEEALPSEEEAPQQEEQEEKPAPKQPKSSAKKQPLKKGKQPEAKLKPQPIPAKAVPASLKSSSKKPAEKTMPAKKAVPAARETPVPVRKPVQSARAVPGPRAPIAARTPAPTVSPSRRVLPQRTVPAASTGARPRILPGGLTQQPTPKTYVPPARQKLLPRIQPEETEEKEEQEEAEEEKPRVPPMLPRLKKKKQEEEEQPEENEQAPTPEEEEIPEEKAEESEEEGQAEKEEASSDEVEVPEEKQPSRSKSLAGMKMKKQVSDERVEEEKTPSELAEERRISEKSRQLQQLSLSKKQREISGQATLPEQEEEELEAPKPPKDDELDAPKPEDYGEAKEEFRHKMEQEEVKEHARESSDALVEQYAKDNIVWLYEIYKMGGMGREDFLSKARDKMNEEQSSGKEEAPVPENPALSALQDELEKKKKKKWF
ncbi:Uncharacterised protein [uncultured archaeon]|nr:Uncharacterised protein [uncultured archaeon]